MIPLLPSKFALLVLLTPQTSHASQQSVLLLEQLVVEVVVPLQFVTVGGRLSQNVHFGRSLLVLQRRYLSLQLLEQIFEAYSSLSLHVVVQISLLDRLGLLQVLGGGGSGLLEGLLLRLQRQSLFLAALAVFLAARVVVVVAVFGMALALARLAFAVIARVHGSYFDGRVALRAGGGERAAGAVVVRDASSLLVVSGFTDAGHFVGDCGLQSATVTS